MAKLVSLPTDRTLTARVLRQYDRTDSIVRGDGRDWYAIGHQFCVDLAAETDGRYSIEQIAGIVAVLSPRNSWNSNMRDARKLVIAALAGDEWPTNLVALNANRIKAIRILCDEDPFVVVSGPKVTAFWRNLCGDPSHITIDVWIMRALGFDIEVPTPRMRRAIDKAVRRSAELRNETPSAMQAIIWIAARGSAI